tara:strand:+ start:4896 stop:6806 length:1911 start_codon:yes stop_codon:yes gene_type:complete
MPKKGRKANVRQQVRSAGQRSVEFEQGQRRVSTPRGRSTTLSLAQRPQQSATDRLSIYAQQTAQQVGRAQQRERMTAFYKENMDRQEAEDRARREEAERQQALKLQRQESARARRDRARAEVRDIRGRQAQQQADEQRQMGERLGRAQQRVEASKQRRQQLQFAQAQATAQETQQRLARASSRVEANRQRRQQQQLAQAEAQQRQDIAVAEIEQRRQGAREGLELAREGIKEKIRSRERIAEQQLALQERGQARQDRLIQEHFTQMRGMFLNAQAGQERRIGELENTMRQGIRAIQNRTGQDKVDITYLNDAVGRQLDHEGLRPPPQQLTLTRADTTDSEASELARQISGVDTGRHRPSQFRRSPTAPPESTTSGEFRDARKELKKTLTGADIPDLARAYNRELDLEAGASRRARALAIDRRLQFLQDDPTPTPQQLSRRTAFLQEGSSSPLALEPEPEGQLVRTETGSTTPFIDSDEESRPPTRSKFQFPAVIPSREPEPELRLDPVAPPPFTMPTSQTAKGLVEDVISSGSSEDEEGEGLLENTNPLEELGGGKYATGSDKRGWESKLGFTITDITGSIIKSKKGAEYFLMKKDAKPTGNYQLVDKTKPKLTGWRSIRIVKLNDLIRDGKVSVS